MNLRFSGNKVGAVLPLVLGILLTVTFLLTSLLQMPGGVRRVAMRRAQMQQQMYDTESALIAYLEGFPEGYFAQEPWNVTLPKVERSRLGPWADLSANLSASAGEKRIHVLAIFDDKGKGNQKAQILSVPPYCVMICKAE